MTVMNDRSEGGSAYFDNGRIELMINRRGNTTDDLGNDESLNETALFEGMELGVRVNAKYYLLFTQSRSDAFGSIRKRYLRTQHPLQHFQTHSDPELSVSSLLSNSDSKKDLQLTRLNLDLKSAKVDELYLRLFSENRVLMTLAGSD